MIRKLFDVDPLTAFRIVGMTCGVVFVAVWTLFVRDVVGQGRNVLVYLAIGVLAPITFQFYGHIELYAPFMVLCLLMFWLVYRYTRFKQDRYLWLALVAQVCALKFHILGLLFLPITVYYLINRFASNKVEIKSWKQVLMFVLIPIILLGSILYFFVLGDHNDPRFLGTNVSAKDRVFLPLIPADSPLNRYHLFHLYHLLDYLNIILMWSIPSIMLIIWGIKRRVHAYTILVGSTLIICTVFFFFLNPLLGLPLDFDLFILPSIGMIVFGLVLQGKSQIPASRARLLIVTAVIGFAPILVNTNKQSIGKRLIQVGAYSYRSYWIHSAQIIDDGLNLINPSSEEYIQTHAQLLKRLDHLAKPGEDREYAHLAFNLGRYYRKHANQQDSALHYHLRPHLVCLTHKSLQKVFRGRCCL